MSSREFSILLAAAKNGSIDLYIPCIVLDEVFNKFRQRLEKYHTDIDFEFEGLNRDARTNLKHPITSDFILECIYNYEYYIKELISIHHIHILPYPKTSHQYLAKKAMYAKKPFNVNEKGYRDNLIWENIKTLISKKDVTNQNSLELIFITANRKDFLTDEGDFHEDLVFELKREGYQTDYIFAFQSVYEFNRDVLAYKRNCN